MFVVAARQVRGKEYSCNATLSIVETQGCHLLFCGMRCFVSLGCSLSSILCFATTAEIQWSGAIQQHPTHKHLSAQCHFPTLIHLAHPRKVEDESLRRSPPAAMKKSTRVDMLPDIVARERYNGINILSVLLLVCSFCFAGGRTRF